MKKIISIFVIVMILGVMFTGCDTKEVAVEDDGFVKEIEVNEIVVKEIIITEHIITENIISWDDAQTWDD